MLDNQLDSANKKRGLGRGLGSLLGQGMDQGPVVPEKKTPAPHVAPPSPQAVPEKVDAGPASQIERIWKVQIDKLMPGKYQPRQEFEKEALQELSQSIRSNGILQPIVARKMGNHFEIIAGERRWRAAQLAGLHEVPVILKEFKDQQALELALVENIQRADLNPIEEAEAYQRLSQEFNLSQQQIAEKVGKERATVANALRLLSLSPEIIRMIIEKTLSVGHAKVLLSLNQTSKQTELAKKTLKEKLSVRKLEKIVQDELKAEKDGSLKTEGPGENVTNRLIAGISEELQKMLGTKVTIDYNQGKGKINISFYSDEEFSNTVERLKRV